MKKSIVITSIFEPTEAIRKFSNFCDADQGYNLIVVGDRKSPKNWQHQSVKFISVDDQLREFGKLAQIIPWDAYQRKNLGYVQAILEDAEIIVDTDDDNIPYDGWEFPPFGGEFDYLPADMGMINIYQLYSSDDTNIWPRGLPLSLITKDFALASKVTKAQCQVGIWQGLADKSPDVDAIYRLTDDTEYNFAKRGPVVLGENSISAYNSQNTATCKELFPLLYLPAKVSFRYTDILRAWVAQPIMWAHGYQLGFTDATVYQDRNPHDYFDDFKLEVEVYLTSERAIEIAQELANDKVSIADNMLKIYTELIKEKIVGQGEIEILETWLKAIRI